MEASRDSSVFTGLVPPIVSFSRYKFLTTLPQFSKVLDNDFLTTLAVRVPQSLCKQWICWTESCVSTNCCSDSMARNLVFIFWLVSVHVLIVVPCIRFTYMKCLMDESLPLSVAVLKQTVVPVLIRSSAALFLL